MRNLLVGARIGLLTTSASRLGGGVSEAVLVQAGLIRAAGGEAFVFAIDDEHTAEDAPRFAPSPVIACRVIGPRQFGYAAMLVDRLIEAKLDCLHLHGIWTYPSRAGLVWARRTGRPYVISPHAMLSQWVVDRSRWKKALARTGYEQAGWRAATCFHALTRREAVDIARETGRDDSLVIPNAGHPAGPDRSALPGPQILFISRIHAIKNIPPMVAAWLALDRDKMLPTGARMTIAGWGEAADVAALEAMLAGAPPSIRYVGPCFGTDKQRAMSEARFVILPSLREGLPMTMLEAWAGGIPTIMNDQCGLPEGFAAGAALDCGLSEHTLRAALARALAMPEREWLAMSQAALGLARGTFSGERIAQQWAEAYARLIAAGPGGETS